MSWVAVAVIGFSAIKTAISIKSTQDAAKRNTAALKQEADIKTAERAKQTRRLVAQQKTSFLSSGISLTGEGTPQAMFDDTYDIGMEDIGNIKQQYNSKISNIWADARSSMMSDLSSFALTAATSGIGGGASAGSKTGAGISAGTTANTMNYAGTNVGGSFGTSALNFGSGSTISTVGSNTMNFGGNQVGGNFGKSVLNFGS